MVTYLKHERKNIRAIIKDYFFENKDKIPEELFKFPLRELTYEKKASLNPAANGLVTYIDDYIHSYKIKFDKGITLEDALKKIIWLFPQ